MSILNGKGTGSNYRWYILALAALTFAFAISMPMFSMPVLFKEISEDLDLNLVQLGTVWGMNSLGAIFVILIGGLLGDRFGVKRILTVLCFLAGLAGALRGLSDSFITLAATMFLFGLLTAILPPTLHKACGVWLPGRHLGLANGVVATGMALGATVGALISATILSPLLGGWSNVLLLYGAISIAFSVLWLLSRSKPSQVELPASHENAVSLRQALSRVVHIKGVWLIGFIFFGQSGCAEGMVGYLPLYLREIGWTPASADGALAALNGISMITVIPMALLSDRLGSRKAVLFAATLMTAIGVGLLSVAGGAMVWASMILAGIARVGFMALLITLIIEIEGVGPTYAGSAMGLAMTIGRVSTIISPPIGNSLAGINLGLPFVFWAALATMALFGLYFVKERK